MKVEDVVKRLEPHSLKKEDESLSGVYLFGSIDIVESTYLKLIRPDWVRLINTFYDKVIREVREKDFKFWKYVGDEVLFYKKLTKNDLESYHEIPRYIFDIMNKIKKELHESYRETKMFLSLKGTLWIADMVYQDVEELDKQESKPIQINHNYLIEKSVTIEHGDIKVIDFLGPDIDLGFRIGAKSMKNQLIVSAEFVYLQELIGADKDSQSSLSQLSNYRIFSKESLKGIWHNRKYPIVLYRSSWDNVFEYDEEFYDGESVLERCVSEKLKKIFEDVGRKDTMDHYFNIIKFSEVGDPKEKKKVLEYPVDVHLAVILFDKQTKKVLLMKRGQKKSSPDYWDFGCVNLKQDESIEESLVKYYSGISDNIVFARNDASEKIKPVGIYEYRKDNSLINGLLFTGVINSEHLPKTFKDYEEVKFFDIGKINDLKLFSNSKEHVDIARDFNFQ